VLSIGRDNKKKESVNLIKLKFYQNRFFSIFNIWLIVGFFKTIYSKRKKQERYMKQNKKIAFKFSKNSFY
jgi:hypothetical protein